MDLRQQMGVIVLMQMLPFYDDAAIDILQAVEGLFYEHLSGSPVHTDTRVVRMLQKRHCC